MPTVDAWRDTSHRPSFASTRDLVFEDGRDPSLRSSFETAQVATTERCLSVRPTEIDEKSWSNDGEERLTWGAET